MGSNNINWSIQGSDGKTLTIEVIGCLNLVTSQDFLSGTTSRLDTADLKGTEVIIDFSQASLEDSRAIVTILKLIKFVKGQGGSAFAARLDYAEKCMIEILGLGFLLKQ